MSLCPHGYTAFWDCPECPEPMGTAGAVGHACDICGYSGTDHQTPRGTWIHVACGQGDLPRRIQMQKWCEAERKIYEATQAVEGMAADIRLTDAVCLLGAARDRVADFVDGVEGKRTIPREP